MIRRNTPARAAQNREYNRLVKLWLAQPENTVCIVSQVLRWDLLRATQCHHARGKIKALLLDQRFWIPVSMVGHMWVDRHPRQAIALGLVGVPWNHQPGPDVPAIDFDRLILDGQKLRDKNPEWSKL